VVRTILCKVSESFAVLVHDVGPLLKVQELLLLVVHDATRDVVPPENLAELSPWNLVAIQKDGGEGRPPGTHGPAKRLGRDSIFCISEQWRRPNLASVL
jgi:hypothetical protein